MTDFSVVVRRPAFWLLMAMAVACADQASKYWVVHSSLLQNSHELTPFLRLVYAENTGSAFGFLAQYGEWARWVLSAAAAILSVILAVWLFFRPPPLDSAALSLLLGGAIGNLTDRVRLGYVVDFIDAHIGGYHWPAFNIADSAITLGALLLIWTTIFAVKTKPPQQTTTTHDKPPQ